MIAILALLLALQVTPEAPMPKGTGLPPPESEEGQVMAPVDALLAGIGARDAAAIGATLAPEGGATIATENPDGTRTVTRMRWPQLLARFTPGPERFRETLGTPAIEIDGDIAMVWAPYVFAIDGKRHHCGVDHFELIREHNAWKIQNLSWSSRTTGCEAQ